MKPKKRNANPNIKAIVLTFKVNAEEMRIILGKALASTGGNVSAFIRKSVGLKS